MKGKYFISIIYCAFLGCSNNENVKVENYVIRKKSSPSEQLETLKSQPALDTITSQIFKYPEVAAKKHLIDSISKGKRSLLVYTHSQNMDSDTILFYVAEDNGHTYVNYFTFQFINSTHTLSKLDDQNYP